METLKDYLEFFSQFGCSEIEIVEKYIIDKNLEHNFSEMLIRLLDSALMKEKAKYSDAKMIIYEYNNAGSIKHNPNYTPEENEYINFLINVYAFNNKSIPEHILKTAKEKVPSMEMPTFCYINLIAYLNEQGIRFKNQEKDMEEI